MAVQVKASARLAAAAQQIQAATAADAGKIVLWVQKATGAEGKASGKAGGHEKVAFKIKAGKDTLTIDVGLDVKNGGVLTVGMDSKLLGEFEGASAKTGRQVIIALKNQMRAVVADADSIEAAPETVKLLKKLISAKSKVEG